MEVNIAIAVDHYLITNELNLKSLHGYSKLPIRPTSTNYSKLPLTLSLILQFTNRFLQSYMESV